MYGLNSSQFAAMAFLWPALVAESASELASATARGFADLAIGPQPPTREPQWTTPNRVALELPSVRLRDFSTSADGSPTLLCAPFALHQATSRILLLIIASWPRCGPPGSRGFS